VKRFEPRQIEYQKMKEMRKSNGLVSLLPPCLLSSNGMPLVHPKHILIQMIAKALNNCC
jgi:hypothetical protein